MSMVVIGTAFVDIKGFPEGVYLPTGRTAGTVEYIHGGVARNVAEDIANVELRPVFLGTVDDSPMGKAVLEKLRRHKVNTDYMTVSPDGMGLWLAIFDESGDLAGSVSKRPNVAGILKMLEEKGDEIFARAESAVLQVDLQKDIVKKTIELARKHGTKLFALVSNMTIAAERRDFLKNFDCFICNQEEAGILFLEDYSGKTPGEMEQVLADRVMRAKIPSMVVTMGAEGAVYAGQGGIHGWCPARRESVRDTTGAGDAFCAGVSMGLTYGRDLAGAVEIGTRLAASVITSSENVCPRFHPDEFGLSFLEAEQSAGVGSADRQ